MSKIRMEGKFKSISSEKVKKDNDEQFNKPKFNLVCIGNVKNSKSRVVLSEKAQVDQKWSTTTLKAALIELQKKVNAIVEGQHKHKRMMAMSSKHFTFDCQAQIKRNNVTFDNTSVAEQEVGQMATHQIRFDDGIFFFFSSLLMLSNHGSQFDAHQILNIFSHLVRTPNVKKEVESVHCNPVKNISHSH